MKPIHRTTRPGEWSYAGLLLWGFSCAVVAQIVWTRWDTSDLTRIQLWVEFIFSAEILASLVFVVLRNSSPLKRGLGYSLVGFGMPFATMTIIAIANLVEFGALEPPPLPAIQVAGMDYIFAALWGLTFTPFAIVSTLVYWLVAERG